eukprot:CAMPEP_0206042580 /NCGR_PEP_ID=MMETSP1466-20131121/6641_1 /ASSEMBLY_ACC=CAM_ASM_001126 /TAXON_ID=44452 /ORGANISM="Pavlova gyrans, Strain CCMP608" /LENGTH=454 /DNA_ID=CAMNT_0053417293 /DNA_START=32 /DNA_END=1391 /DNA_ORIENTATION=+
MDASERTRRLSELSVILNSPSFRSFPDKEIRAGGLHKLEPEVRDKHLSAALEVRRIAVAEDIIGSHSLVWKRTIGQGMFATVELFRLDRKAKRTKSLAGRIAAALDSIPCLAAQEDNRERYPNVVAAKVLRSHLLRSDNYTHGDKMPMYQVAFFQAEAALLKHLRHENIVETYGIVALPFGPRSLDTRLAILQEFCPGGTLKRRIRKVDYTASQGLAWLSDVARGMAFLHEETGFAIAHRDLKPDNVILTSTGVAKIADFGLSRLLDRSSAQLTPQESEHSITESDESDESSPASPNTPRADATGRVGSMRYMAPENILSQPYSCKVDVFSFGILALGGIDRPDLLRGRGTVRARARQDGGAQREAAAFARQLAAGTEESPWGLLAPLAGQAACVHGNRGCTRGAHAEGGWGGGAAAQGGVRLTSRLDPSRDEWGLRSGIRHPAARVDLAAART